MKTTITALLVAMLCVQSFAQERTTSEVKRDFEKEYKTLMRNLRNADLSTIGPLNADVEKFENDYKQYREFLNKAVFPDGFDGTIEKLQDQLSAAKELVESKDRIAKLEEQIRNLTGQVDNLNKENTALLEQVKKLRNEVSELRKTVARLQDNIAKRDAIVFALVDSLFVQYDKQKLSAGDMKRFSSLEKNNVLSNIKRSVNDNVAFLSADGMSGLDFPRLLDEQRKFELNWKGVGGKLADAYTAAKDRTKEIAEVNTMIDGWRGQVDEAFWKALNKLFADENLNIAVFTNGDEFHANIIRFIDEEMANAGNKSSADQLRTFEAFAYNAWGAKVKPVWIPVMKRYEMYTDTRESEIDTKITLWQAQVQPGNMLLYALVAALVIAVLVGLYLGMKKRQPTA
jgi:cell division protein FtsB